jgi:uncharacterized metal-binding protein YceD (DUF177 family)
MRINRQLIPLNKEVSFAEEIDFSQTKFDSVFIRKITSCQVKAKAFQSDKILRIVVDVKSEIVAISGYSLQDVPLSIKAHDELIFSDDPQDENAIYEPKNIFDIDNHILSIILAHIPNRVVGKGEKLPESGKGYRILTEEEYLKEKETKTDSRWEKLDSVKIE